jgi:hypothetical protein
MDRYAAVGLRSTALASIPPFGSARSGLITIVVFRYWTLRSRRCSIPAHRRCCTGDLLRSRGVGTSRRIVLASISEARTPGLLKKSALAPQTQNKIALRVDSVPSIKGREAVIVVLSRANSLVACGSSFATASA